MSPAWQLMAPSQGGDGQQPNLLVQLIPFAAIILIFYFLLIAPARKRQKKMQEMLGALKNGDKVVTTGGIYGTIVRVGEGGEDRIRLRIAPSVEIEVTRAAIAGLQTEPPQGS